MAGLDIVFEKIDNIVVDPNQVQGGTTNIFSYPVVVGEYIATISIQLITLSINFAGNNENTLTSFRPTIEANGLALAQGLVDIAAGLSGLTSSSYAGLTIAPIGYTPAGVTRVGSTAVYVNYQVNFLSDVLTATVG